MENEIIILFRNKDEEVKTEGEEMLKSLQNLRAFYYQVELSFEPKTVEFLKKLLNKEKLEFPFILHSKKELIHF